MASHSRALVDILFKNTKKKDIAKVDIKKEVKKTNKK